jgi:hypothetical protein
MKQEKVSTSLPELDPAPLEALLESLLRQASAGGILRAVVVVMTPAGKIEVRAAGAAPAGPLDVIALLDIGHSATIRNLWQTQAVTPEPGLAPGFDLASEPVAGCG